MKNLQSTTSAYPVPRGTLSVSLHSDGKSLQIASPSLGFSVLVSDGGPQADLQMLDRLRALLIEDAKPQEMRIRVQAVEKANALLRATRREELERKFKAISDGKVLSRKIARGVEAPKSKGAKRQVLSLSDLDL